MNRFIQVYGSGSGSVRHPAASTSSAVYRLVTVIVRLFFNLQSIDYSVTGSSSTVVIAVLNYIILRPYSSTKLPVLQPGG